MPDNKDFSVVGPRILKLLIRALECQDDAPLSAEDKMATAIGILYEYFPEVEFTDPECNDVFEYYIGLYDLLNGKKHD